MPSLPLRLRHGKETARILGYPSAEALRKARERGYLPEDSFVKQGKFYYYFPHRFLELKNGEEKKTTSGTERKLGAISDTVYFTSHFAREALPGAIAGRDKLLPSKGVSNPSERKRSIGTTSLARGASRDKRKAIRARIRKTLNR